MFNELALSASPQCNLLSPIDLHQTISPQCNLLSPINIGYNQPDLIWGAGCPTGGAVCGSSIDPAPISGLPDHQLPSSSPEGQTARGVAM